jgi:hypothetical protein
MANTYTQICIHIVFAVQGRQDVIGQEGFGAFSYSHSQLRTVIRYIQNQQEHHQRKSFNQEYVELLKRFNVPHEERYIFQPVEPD